METHNNVRPPATLTVLEKSRELHILLSKVTADDNLLQKAFRFTIGEAVTDHSQDIYESLAVANSLDLYDKELTEERLKYQTQARRAVTKLLAALRVMYTISQMSSDKMKILIDKTIEVERLLKMWLESDRNRVGASLGVVKKDEIDTTIFNNEITARDLFAPAPHVDFELLLKDSRNNLPPTVRNDGNRFQFIPPGECIQTAPPPVKYVVKSDAERESEVKQGIFELDKKEPAPPMPMLDKPKSTFALESKIIPVTTKPEVEVVVWDTPIIVPDNRITPLPLPTKAEQEAEVQSTKVSIMTGFTPDMLVEDTASVSSTPTSMKEDNLCSQSQPVSSVPPAVSTTEPTPPTEPTVTPADTEKSSASASENQPAPSPVSSTSTSEKSNP